MKLQSERERSTSNVEWRIKSIWEASCLIDPAPTGGGADFQELESEACQANGVFIPYVYILPDAEARKNCRKRLRARHPEADIRLLSEKLFTKEENFATGRIP